MGAGTTTTTTTNMTTIDTTPAGDSISMMMIMIETIMSTKNLAAPVPAPVIGTSTGHITVPPPRVVTTTADPAPDPTLAGAAESKQPSTPQRLKRFVSAKSPGNGKAPRENGLRQRRSARA